MWIAPNLDKDKHCFLGAKGGVSKGIYAELNVNTKSDDEIASLNANLDIAAAKFGLSKENMVLLNQGVSDVAVYVEAPSRDEIFADGLVCDKKGIILCIRTADCAPILLEDRVHNVVGAAHAGWRGAFKGIIENVIALMVERGARLENIRAAVGPCIAQKSYEVDKGFYEQFEQKNPEFVKYFVAAEREEHYLFDLKKFCEERLKECGIKDIAVSAADTYELENDYFSFRRFTHLGIVQKPKCFATEISMITL